MRVVGKGYRVYLLILVGIKVGVLRFVALQVVGIPLDGRYFAGVVVGNLNGVALLVVNRDNANASVWLS